ncbi:c-type cytochrome [Gloeothece verrucosa]|uniref:c-type cytochrome n=1 Tax=Gloeothece verrucosa TaxID=2546359 RepID=UPI003CCAED18
MAIGAIVAVIFLGLYISRVYDPYVQEVLSLKGDLARGYEIFQINCAGCHGQQADGSVGPSLHHVPKRKSKVRLIEQVISGDTPPMPKFQPSPQEMADLLNYLERL